MARTLFAWVSDNWQELFQRTSIVFLLALIFFVAGGGVSHNARWRVEQVDVRGTQAVDREAVRAFVFERLAGNYFFVYARNNSFLFPARAIEADIRESFLRIGHAEVTKVDPHTIAVAVVERKPYALWCGNEVPPEMYELAYCSFVDETGFVFDYAPVFSEGVYAELYGVLEGVVEGRVLGARFPKEQFVFLRALEKEMQREVGEVLRMVVAGEGEYRVIMKKSARYPTLSGVELRIKQGGTPETLTKNILAALAVQFPDATKAISGKPAGTESKKKLEYIDLRFGNKIFFGFEN